MSFLQFPKQHSSVEINLSSKGCDLRQHISDLVGYPSVQLKMICAGVVIKDDLPLSQQSVKV